MTYEQMQVVSAVCLFTALVAVSGRLLEGRQYAVFHSLTLSASVAVIVFVLTFEKQVTQQEPVPVECEGLLV